LQRKGFSVEHLQDLNRRTLREAADRFLDKIRPNGRRGYFAAMASNRHAEYLIPVDATDLTRTGRSAIGVLERLLTVMYAPRGASVLRVHRRTHRNPFEAASAAVRRLAALGSVSSGKRVLLSSARASS
jgi:hypothetical protein